MHSACSYRLEREGMNCMTLREICETLAISRRAIQGYEKAGLVVATGRNKYGHLLYDDLAKSRIEKIKFYQQLGFTIKEITIIIDAPNVVIKEALERQVQKLRKKKTEIDELIEKANQMIVRLSNEDNHDGRRIETNENM